MKLILILLFFQYGDDNSGCGRSKSLPCQSIKYTIEIEAANSFGAVINLLPGDYFETNYTTIANANYTIVGVDGPDYTMLHSNLGLFYVNNSNFILIGVSIVNTTTNLVGEFVKGNTINADALEADISFNNPQALIVTISQNAADYIIYSKQSLVWMRRSIIMSNNAYFLTFCLRTIFFFEYGIVTYNTADYALFFDTSILKIARSRFRLNASLFGNIIANNRTLFNISESIFRENVSSYNGGVFSIQGDNQSKFDKNYAPASAAFSISSKGIVVSLCEFIGQTKATTQVTMYGVAVTLFADCSFKGMIGTLFQMDQVSILYIVHSKVSMHEGKMLTSYGRGEAIITNTEVSSNNYSDDLIVIFNRARVYLLLCSFINNTVSSFVTSKYGAKVVWIASYANNNTLNNHMFVGFYQFEMTFDNAWLGNNIGLNKGVFIQSDQTGSISMTNSHFINNTAQYGTVLYLRTPTKHNLTFLSEMYNNTYYSRCVAPLLCTHCPENPRNFCYFGFFENNTIIGNSVSKAGAIVYYEKNDVLMRFICRSCYERNNTADHGQLYNTYFDSFEVIVPRTMGTPEQIQAIFLALDAFGNRLQGRTDVSFFISSCPNVTLTGIRNVGLSMVGMAVMYNIKVSAPPGTVCNFTFTAVSLLLPTPQVINVSMVVRNCTGDATPYIVEDTYYCLTLHGISNILKIIMSTIAIVITLFLMFCIAYTFYKREHPIIHYSNQYFMYTVLFGCLLSSVSIFPTLFVGTFVTAFAIIPTGIIAFISIFIHNLKPRYVYDLNNSKVAYTCGNSDNIYLILIYIYLVAICLVGSVMAIKFRKYKTRQGTFHEPNVIGIMLYNGLILLIIIIPLRFSFPQNPNASTIIVGSVIFVFALSTSILNDAIVVNLKKTIEEQENELQRNKDILKFYSIYGDENDHLDFANQDIFSPNSPTTAVVDPNHFSPTSSSISSSSNLSSSNSHIGQFSDNILFSDVHGIPDPQQQQHEQGNQLIESDDSTSSSEDLEFALNQHLFQQNLQQNPQHQQQPNNQEEDAFVTNLRNRFKERRDKRLSKSESSSPIRHRPSPNNKKS
ncbi:G-protein-coupled receptor family 3 protein 17 [Cavenderia fasciculata]|uniref:G-protein-coupled receptor family 3 protein 17 n=1 Tax=Cavenderia fasciculata TaxID=261658 RepID=F4PI75_CACFS|nr:G-protein-coupled receptor family 3 protein 17 [Cavenderia fasciculata]EGG25358.1 G-protein-coupled receptor family 3 protein 17 [Cavenderia fasciculata]|eukprot:XP_004363209.1 G-protein-coupled receptor family 3 protein 17 [Cavenderia fasciculata]